VIDTDALLARVDLVAIVQKDVQLRYVASTNYGEWAGPCPFCQAGTDRFRVWPHHPGGRGRWWCRMCGRSGDAIEYLVQRDALTFAAAVEALGGDVDQASTSSTRPAPRRSPRPAVPQVERPGPAWQQRARAFCEFARRELWGNDGAGARAYLGEMRGLQEETIRRFGLGWNPQCAYDRQVSRWGLDSGKAVYLSRGLVIPCWEGEQLWYVQVRRPLEGGPLLAYAGGDVPIWQAGVKYLAVRGGVGKALFGADNLRGRDVLLLCEGEFDGMLAWQELQDLVDVATFGGATKGAEGIPGPWLLRLLHYRALLTAYDVDEGGDRGAAALAARDRRAVRVQVPEGGDLVGFWQAGGDLRAWLQGILDDLT